MKGTSQTGAAAVEFALVLPLLILMVFGITEYGRAIYQYDTLTKAARTAARHLSTASAGDDVAKSQARCLAVTGDYTTAGGQVTCSGTPVAPGLATTMVEICDATTTALCTGNVHASVNTGAGVANLVTVRITAYPFNSIVPLLVPDMNFGSAANHTGISVTMRQDL